MFLAVEFDFSTRILPEKYLVSGFKHPGRLPSLLLASRAHCHHSAFLRLLFGGVWDDDTPFSLFRLFDALNDDPIV